MMTLPYIAWIVGFGVVPALLYLWVKVDYRVWYKEIGFRIGLIVLSAVVVLVLQKFSYQDYAGFVRK